MSPSRQAVIVGDRRVVEPASELGAFQEVKQSPPRPIPGSASLCN
jgi:hypothetical protein